jgi:glutaredoxin
MIRFIDFYSIKCSPCINQKNNLEDFKRRNINCEIEYIDIEKDNERYQELKEEFNLDFTSIPFLIVLQDGELVYEKGGCHTKEMLEEVYIKVKLL